MHSGLKYVKLKTKKIRKYHFRNIKNIYVRGLGLLHDTVRGKIFPKITLIYKILSNRKQSVQKFLLFCVLCYVQIS